MSLHKTAQIIIDKKTKKYADDVLKVMKQEVHVQSGALRDSLESKKVGKGHYFVGVNPAKLKADPRNAGGKNYSIPYYYGHNGYTIKPKNKKVLSWIGKDGQRKFAAYVRIPPHPGDPFIERTILRRPKIK